LSNGVSSGQHPLETENKIPGPATVWSTAARPFAYSASALAVSVGFALASGEGQPIHWGPLAITLLGVLCFHTGANILNDCFDYQRGLDTEVLPTSGAVVRGWITESQALKAGGGLLAVGVLCGLALTWYAGWVVLLLGVAGALCAVGYTTPRFCLKYAGGGDLTVFLAFGVLVVFGTFWVQTRRFDWLPILWSLPVALLTVGILHANNWRDLASDPGKGCRTVASRLGSRASGHYYRVLVLSPFGLVGLYALLGRFPQLGLPTPIATLLAFLALPMALRLARAADPDLTVVPALLDARTAQLHLLFCLLCSAAFFISRYVPALG
jgi:1,4-dihydroxy-2-naphthoate octaprenyltransferase